MRRRNGFTIIEVLVVTLIIGILAGIALLKYMDLRATARTTSLVGDIRAIQVATVNYYADFETWPPDAGGGLVPPGLEPYLPGGLNSSFDRTFYVLDFENTVVASAPMVGVSVTSTDPTVIGKFISVFGNRTPFFMNGGTLTYMIAGPGGIF